MKDYYKILNINFQASEYEIKKQYRKLAKIYHPDKNGGSKFYEDNFKLIVEAYETLSNNRKRNAYDSKYNQYFSNIANKRTNSTNETKHKTNYDNVVFEKKTTFDFIIKYKYIFLLLFFYFLIVIKNCSISTTTGNPKADKELKNQKTERPQTGDLDFK